MQNHGYLEMTSPPWPQNKPSCQGTSRKIWRRVQGNPLLDVVIVPSLKADQGETPLTSINPLGIETLLNLSQITKVLVQKTVFFPVPHTRRDVSQTLRVHSVLEISSIGPADSLNCVRLQDSFPLISQEVYELLQKGALQKTIFLAETAFTATCFLYPKRENLCVR